MTRTATQSVEHAGVWTIVVAAGSGSRFGGPKQFAPLGGRRVVDHSIRAAAAVSEGIVVVLPSSLVEDANLPAESGDCGVLTVAGGETRSASVRAGLDAVPESATIILVHDGARPLAPVDLFADVIAAIGAGADAAIPTTPVTDTIRHVDTGVVDRSALVAVQTPQAFRAAALRAAHTAGAEATDDAGLVEANGGTVMLVAGSETNLKITNPDDLVVAEALLAGRQAPTLEGGERP